MGEPGVTRRGVLRAAGLGAVAVVAGGAVAASPLISGVVGAVNLRAGPATRFTHAAFAPLTGTTFKVEVNGSSVDLVLASIMARPAVPGGENFSLLFDGDPAVAFAQGTYQVRHPALSQFAMFIVPVNQPERSQRYEAAINNRSRH